MSESKEVEREDDNQLREQIFHPSRVKQMPRHLLAEVDANDRRNRKPVNRTDSWLERHFGSTSSLSASSTELSRQGSGEGYKLWIAQVMSSTKQEGGSDLALRLLKYLISS